VAVPHVEGLSRDDASAAITAAKLKVGTITQQTSNTVGLGKVISQDPASGNSVAEGSPVDLVVSSGPPMVSVPDVGGMTRDAATAALTGAKLKAGDITQKASGAIGSGKIISQDPAGGSSVAEGSSVKLVISSGPQMVPVPEVEGMTRDAATTALTGAKLKVGDITQKASNTTGSGKIISQDPASGSSVAEGSPINLVISSGPPIVTVPNVERLSQDDATTAITAAKLTMGTLTQQASNTVANGNVIKQEPTSGSLIAEGSPVNLMVSSGPQMVTTVPNVEGLTQAAATTAITGAKLMVGTVTQQSSNTVTAGNVISQNPTNGSTLAQASPVNLVISSGPQIATVPNVGGLTQTAASTAITEANLTVGNVTQQISNTVTGGNVISQEPENGSSVAEGSPVNLVISSGPQIVTIPDVKGMTQDAATTAISAAKLKVGIVTEQTSNTVGKGHVISQVPAPGGSAAEGSLVKLLISSGPQMVTVPNVNGLTQAAATTAIVKAKLKVTTVTQRPSNTVATGNVISQDPVGGSSAAAGSPINLVISSGPPMVTVPTVAGLTQSAAVAAITRAKLTVGTVTATGKIISQDPASGSSVAEGAAVNLVISLGPQMVTVPKLEGLSQTSAVAAVTAANLSVGTITQQNSNTVIKGNVVSQDQPSGSSLAQGSPVNLVISSGPEMATVPNVEGLTQAAATAAINAAKLKVGKVTQQTGNTVAPGKVINQDPVGGGSVVQDSPVNLVISSE
jgi:beta-lactam-binding protein with PASTA domain